MDVRFRGTLLPLCCSLDCMTVHQLLNCSCEQALHLQEHRIALEFLMACASNWRAGTFRIFGSTIRQGKGPWSKLFAFALATSSNAGWAKAGQLASL